MLEVKTKDLIFDIWVFHGSTCMNIDERYKIEGKTLFLIRKTSRKITIVHPTIF